MATVRKPSSLAARKMRIAISLRLAARSLRIGLAFFISEANNVSCEILHCFMVAARLSCSFLNSENKLFLWHGKSRLRRHLSQDYWVLARPPGMACCPALAGTVVTIADFSCRNCV